MIFERFAFEMTWNRFCFVVCTDVYVRLCIFFFSEQFSNVIDSKRCLTFQNERHSFSIIFMFCVHIFLVQTLDYMTNDWQPTKLAFKKETTSIRMYKQLILFGILIWFICALFANDGIKIAFRITKFIATLKIWQISVTFFSFGILFIFCPNGCSICDALVTNITPNQVAFEPACCLSGVQLVIFFYFCIFSHCRRLHHLPLAKIIIYDFSSVLLSSLLSYLFVQAAWVRLFVVHVLCPYSVDVGFICDLICDYPMVWICLPHDSNSHLSRILVSEWIIFFMFF